MEGYLRVKTGFGSMVNMWCICDGSYLTWYEKLEQGSSGSGPRGLKGTLFLKNAEVKKVINEKYPMGIKVRGEKGSKISVNCPDAQALTSWLSALEKAARAHILEEEERALPGKLRDILEIDPSITKLTKSIISRAYKKASLKHHPDKGGDADKFQQLREAHVSLLAWQHEQDEIVSTDIVHYEVLVEKTAQVGLGITVIDDRIRKRLVVQAVSDQIAIHEISPEAEGLVKPGDALIAIESDECVHWTFSRVRARLDAFRVPMNSRILLCFERRVPKLGFEMPEDDFVSPIVTPVKPTKVEPLTSPVYVSAENKSNPAFQEDNEKTFTPELRSIFQRIEEEVDPAVKASSASSAANTAYAADVDVPELMKLRKERRNSNLGNITNSSLSMASSSTMPVASNAPMQSKAPPAATSAATAAASASASASPSTNRRASTTGLASKSSPVVTRRNSVTTTPTAASIASRIFKSEPASSEKRSAEAPKAQTTVALPADVSSEDIAQLLCDLETAKGIEERLKDLNDELQSRIGKLSDSLEEGVEEHTKLSQELSIFRMECSQLKSENDSLKRQLGVGDDADRSDSDENLREHLRVLKEKVQEQSVARKGFEDAIHSYRAILSNIQNNPGESSIYGDSGVRARLYRDREERARKVEYTLKALVANALPY